MSPTSKGSLPCGAVPTRFVIEEPECADRLLRSMNVTNVHILQESDFYQVLSNGIRDYLEEAKNNSSWHVNSKALFEEPLNETLIR
jgi:hypothetical protein